MKTAILILTLGGAPSLYAKHRVPPAPTATPAPEAAELFQRAQGAFKEKRYKDARDCLIQIVAKFPLEQVVPQSRLLLAELEEDYNSSLEQFKRLSQDYVKRPEGREALKDLGGRYYLADRYEEAHAAYQDYLKKYPGTAEEPEVRYWIGCCLTALDRDKEAGDQFDRCIRKDRSGPWAPKAYLALGNAYLKQGQYENARKQYLKILDAYPAFDETNQVYLRLGRAYEALAKPREALASYRTLLARYPRCLEAPEAADRSAEIKKQNPDLAVAEPDTMPTAIPTRFLSATPTVALTEAPAPATPAPDPTAVPVAHKAQPPPPSVFKVQVGVYSVKSYAEVMVEKLRRAGYTPVLTVLRSSGGTYPVYKVRTGRYPDREKARRAALEIKGKLKAPTVVVEEP